MKKIILFICLLFTAICFNSCTMAKPNATQEAVWVKRPWFFGHGGIDMTPVETGLSWGAPSSNVVYFTIIPQRYDEHFDDIFSNDNTPLDFNTYINIQIEKGKTPILLKNYGEDWYKNNIQVYYRNKTREYVSLYSPFDLISNRDVSTEIDRKVMHDVQTYVATLSKNKEFPIKILSITTGAARPNQDQLEEMNKTAQYIQQKRSMEQKAIAEQSRAKAEQNKAIADKAYMNEMHLSPNQFIQLKWIEMISAKQGANVDVLVGGGETPMWNINK